MEPGASESYDLSNPFSRIIDGTLPSWKVCETDDALAFLDAFPMAPYHTLLIPKRKYATVYDMDEGNAAIVFSLIPRISKALREAANAEGVNVVSNIEPAAGQVVSPWCNAVAACFDCFDSIASDMHSRFLMHTST